jgi:hypothetical protein
MVLAQNYAGDVVRTANRTATFLRSIPIVIDEGKNVAWSLEGTGATAQTMAEGADPTAPTSDAQVAATLSWAYYEQSAKITGPAQAAAATSRTPLGNMNQLGRQIANSLATLMSKVNLHCFSGTGVATPHDITGLDLAIGDTTSTYATINRSSTTYDLPYLVNPAVATNITLGHIRDDLAQIYIQSGETPDLAFCHPSVFNEVGNLFDSQRRYIQTVSTVQTARGGVSLNGGFEGLAIDGCVFIKDKDATLESGNASGRIYYVNTNYVSLRVLVQPEFRAAFPQLNMDPEVMLTANDGFGDVPLMAGVVKLAKTGDYAQYMSKVYCELQVKKAKACGMRRFVKLNYAP